MNTTNEISPAELAADLLTRWGLPPVRVVVGPATDKLQQAGVISCMAAGLPVVEEYVPIQWARVQMRCLAGTLAQADNISQAVQRDIHAKVRKFVYMASTDSWYLLHLCKITAGPSMHFDSPETWETLVFAELMLSNERL